MFRRDNRYQFTTLPQSEQDQMLLDFCIRLYAGVEEKPECKETALSLMRIYRDWGLEEQRESTALRINALIHLTESVCGNEPQEVEIGEPRIRLATSIIQEETV